MRIVQRMALFSSLYYSERVRGSPRHVCESETVGGRAQVLPLTMQHNGARGSARRRAARRRASGSECPQSPRLRDLAVVELGRPLGAGASLARHVTAPKWRVLRAGDCESADAYPYLRWALV